MEQDTSSKAVEEQIVTSEIEEDSEEELKEYYEIFENQKYRNKGANCILEPEHQGRGGLYLGSYTDAQDLINLLELKVVCVITAAQFLMLCYPRDIIRSHLVLPLLDDEEFIIKPYFEQVIQHIDQQREQGSVFIHCQAGVSRSATLVIAYLMKTHQWRLAQAAQLVKEKRYIYPNSGFYNQLVEYEKELLQAQVALKKDNNNPQK